MSTTRNVWKSWASNARDQVGQYRRKRERKKQSRTSRARWFLCKAFDAGYLKDMRLIAFIERLHRDPQCSYYNSWGRYSEAGKRPFFQSF